MLDDLQCSQQLALCEARTTAFVGQGRQRADHRLVALELAEVAFHTPDRDEGLAVDAITLFDALQYRAVLQQQGLALAHAGCRECAIEVFPYRSSELRLAAIGLDHAHVRADVGEGIVEGIRSDPGAQRLDTESRSPFLETLGGLDKGGITGRLWCGRRHRCCGHCRQRLGVGGRGLFRTGNEQDETGGGEQSAQWPTEGETKGHARVRIIRIRC